VSQENVELVRAVVLYESPEGIALLASGDLDLSAVDPDIEWDASRLTDMIPDLAGVFRGHDGVLIRDQRQTGRLSGIVTELPPYAMLFTVRSGKLVRCRTFPSQESALKAVGLEE